MDARQPAIGASISTSDGHSLGVVRHVLGDYFQVMDDTGRESWYPASTLGTNGSQVDFDRSNAAARSVPPPNAYEENPYIEPDTRTAEQQQQREEMLAGLAAQRAAMGERGELPDADRSVGEPVEAELDALAQSPHAQPTAEGESVLADPQFLRRGEAFNNEHASVENNADAVVQVVTDERGRLVVTVMPDSPAVSTGATEAPIELKDLETG